MQNHIHSQASPTSMPGHHDPKGASMWVDGEIIDDAAWNGQAAPDASAGGQNVPATLPTPVIFALAALVLAVLWTLVRRGLQRRAAASAETAATEVETARGLTDAASEFVHKLGGWAALAALRPEGPATEAPTFRLSDILKGYNPKDGGQTLVAGSHGVLDVLRTFAHVAKTAESGRTRRVAGLARQAVWDEIKAEVDRATSPETVEEVGGDIERALARVGRLNGLLGLSPCHGTDDKPASETKPAAAAPAAPPAAVRNGEEDRVTKLLRRQLATARGYALRTLRLATSEEWSRVPDRFTSLGASDGALPPLASQPSLALDSAPSNPSTPQHGRAAPASRSPSESPPPPSRAAHSSDHEEGNSYFSSMVRNAEPEALELVVRVRDCGGFVGLLGPTAMQRATSVQATSAARQAFELVSGTGGTDVAAMTAALTTFHQVHGSKYVQRLTSTPELQPRRAAPRPVLSLRVRTDRFAAPLRSSSPAIARPRFSLPAPRSPLPAAPSWQPWPPPQTRRGGSARKWPTAGLQSSAGGLATGSTRRSATWAPLHSLQRQALWALLDGWWTRWCCARRWRQGCGCQLTWGRPWWTGRGPSSALPSARAAPWGRWRVGCGLGGW